MTAIPQTTDITDGNVLQSAQWNNHIKDPIDTLSGDDGIVEFRHAVRPGSYTTAERDALVGETDGSILWNETETQLEGFSGGQWAGILRAADSDQTFARTIDTHFVPPASLDRYLKYWQSGNIVWDDGDLVEVVVPHTLGAVPKGGSVGFRCKQAVGGYSVDDVVWLELHPGSVQPMTDRNSLIVSAKSSTSITFRINTINRRSFWDTLITTDTPGVAAKFTTTRVLRIGSSRRAWLNYSNDAGEYILPQYIGRYSETAFFRIEFEDSYSGTIGGVKYSDVAWIRVNVSAGGIRTQGVAIRLSSGQTYRWDLSDPTYVIGFNYYLIGTDLTDAGSDWTSSDDTLLGNASSVDVVLVDMDSPYVDWTNSRFSDPAFVAPHKSGDGTVSISSDRWDMRVVLWG